MQPKDPQNIKLQSELKIRSLGGKTPDLLPVLEYEEMVVRSREEIIGRVSVMNALLAITFKAPVSVIKKWIENQKLNKFVTDKEMLVLQKINEELSQQELTNLYWYIEAIWALLWVGSMIFELPLDKRVGDNLINLAPNL